MEKKPITNRRSLLAALDDAIIQGKAAQANKASGQVNLFDDDAPKTNNIPLPNIRDDPAEVLAWEKDLLGVYVSGHPLDPYRKYLNCFDPLSMLIEGEAIPPSQSLSVCGVVTDVKRKHKRNGGSWAIVTLEDYSSIAEVFCFGRIWQRSEYILKGGALVVIGGKTQQKGGKWEREDVDFSPVYTLIASRVFTMQEFVVDIEQAIKSYERSPEVLCASRPRHDGRGAGWEREED